MALLNGDAPGSIPLAPHQYIRSNAANDAFEAVTIEPSIAPKRTETFFGTTDGSGNYTVTYSPAYSAVPSVQPQLTAGTNTQIIKITSSTTTGFTVNVQNRTDVIGLLPTYAAVGSSAVSVLVTER